MRATSSRCGRADSSPAPGRDPFALASTMASWTIRAQFALWVARSPKGGVRSERSGESSPRLARQLCAWRRSWCLRSLVSCLQVNASDALRHPPRIREPVVLQPRACGGAAWCRSEHAGPEVVECPEAVGRSLRCELEADLEGSQGPGKDEGEERRGRGRQPAGSVALSTARTTRGRRSGNG